MKKIICACLGILCLFSGMSAYSAPITVLSYVTPNDVSITNLENNQNTIVNAINSADGALLQAGTVSATALTNNARPEERWGRAFNSWVFTGLLAPTTSGTLTSTTTSGEAFIDNSNNQQKFVEKDATAKIYTASKWTFVDIDSLGTYTYTEVAIGAGDPAIPANNLRLFRASTNAVEVTAVRDDRVLAIQLDNTQEDFQRSGLTISVVSPTGVTVSAGIVYWGTVRIEKTGDTSLPITGSFTGGARANNTFGYVAISEGGQLILSTTAPTLHNTDSDTAGTLRYIDVGGTLYRTLCWFYMNDQNTGEVNFNYGNFGDGDAWNIVQVSGASNTTTSSATFVDMSDLTAYFFSSGKPVKMLFDAPTTNSDASANENYVFEVDGVDKKQTARNVKEANAEEPTAMFWTEHLAQGTHTIKVQWKTSAGTLSQNATTDGERVLIVEEVQ